jgi:hypothetical protein
MEKARREQELIYEAISDDFVDHSRDVPVSRPKAPPVIKISLLGVLRPVRK